MDLYDLATSSSDRASRRLVAPQSWMRRSLRSGGEGPFSHEHWGANAVELEIMRYRPRRELTSALRDYDLIQVVAGSPAWASAVLEAGVPVVLQAATIVEWERRASLATDATALRMWRGAMTHLTSRVERYAVREADAVLVENAEMLERVRALGQDRVIKAAPGVDTTFFSPSPAGWQRNGQLLSVCRLADPRKGIDRTILAYAEMARRAHSVPPLVLAGGGTLSMSNQALIADLGLTDRVVVRSNISTVELLALYRSASVFVQTSYEEGLGLSVLEAMACGLPVVATETAGSRETIAHGETGWLTPQSPTSAVPEGIADRVLEILADPRCDLGPRGRKRCLANFSARVALRRFTDTYDALLGR
ncbi:glycosyltransferase [Micromonospora sp. PLK6-60]|uniref:glycosyltransferase n=1 Tax=Micromonospora sp. PLK6-60 TaxID=2873383 RepID=UPI0035ABD72B